VNYLNCLVGLLFFSVSVSAQSNRDTLQLKEVQIHSKREKKELQKIQAIDSLTLVNNTHQSLSELLDYNSTLSFKNYGVGGVSLASIRGTNPIHVKVLWNGISVNSPMLGQFDFSIIPVSSVKKVSVQYGGSSAEFGSGAIGGGIILESGVDFNNRFSIAVNQQAASFHRYGTNVNLNLGNHQWQSQTSFNTLSSKNDFTYRNRTEFNQPEQVMRDAETIQYGIMQEFFHRLSSRTLISLHTWYQWSDQNISPPMFMRNNISKQTDWNWRNVMKWSSVLNDKFSIDLSLGYIKQYIRFQNRMRSGEVIFNLLDTKSYSDFADQKSTLTWHVDDLTRITGGYEFIYEGAIVEDYQGYRDRKRLSVFASVDRNFFRTLDISITGRKEFAENLNPYALSFAASQLIIRHPELKIKANVSRNYNLPTLNDLFWIPGGNPDLQAEEGWHKEAGLSHQCKIHRLTFHSEATAYHAIINNWILWQPSAIENGIWSPQNLRKVRTQGYELSESIELKSDPFLLQLKALYSYTEATNLQGIVANDQSVGKQLIYVPFEMFKISSLIRYKHIALNYMVNRVGYRFTKSDNSDFLPSYLVQQASVNYYFNLRKCTLGAGFKVDNIFNTNYESLPFKPLPGRNYSINISLKFNTNTK
jgi:outer membrane cobalamin receptor